MKLCQLLEAPLNLPLVKQIVQNITHVPLNIKQVEVLYKPHGRAQKKECFNNAYRHLLDNMKSTYVLGFVFVHGIPLEHAWVKDGSTYFDVTLDPTKQDGYVSVAELRFQDISNYVNTYSSAPSLWDMNQFNGRTHSHK